MGIMVFGYKEKSKSARMIAEVLGATYSWPDSGIACREGDVVINWGAGYGYPFWGERAKQWLNKTKAIATSVNKIATFEAIKKAGLGAYIPEYTLDATKALKWIKAGDVVFARQDAEGKAGRGIVVFDGKNKTATDNKAQPIFPKGYVPTLDDLQRGGYQFYTKKFNAKWELKVHVAFGKVHAVWRIEKDYEEFVQQGLNIRNYANGYKFRLCKTDIHPDIKKVCVDAIKAVGLDFGVVDIGVGKKAGEMCVYETNTAPAVDISDAQKYAAMFRKELKIKE